MRKCALLSMDDLTGYYCYDTMLAKPMLQAGWSIEQKSWRSKSNWSEYDAVIVRSTWDYQYNLPEYLTVLKIISEQTFLLNSYSIISWNVNKNYLKSLSESGVKIVPTLWEKTISQEMLTSAFDQFKTEKLIIKPRVSANADNTIILTPKTIADRISELKKIFSDRPFLVQPFVSSIITEGEYSLIFIGNEFSHCLLKKPKNGDFRVQEEHGGVLSLVESVDPRIVNTAKGILDVLPESCLYSRVDLIRYQEEFCLMELELVEPSLYFNLFPESVKLFTNVFIHFFQSRHHHRVST